jgi:hypothetical protein
MGSLCLRASATLWGIILAEGLHDWGMRAVPLFSYTLAFALQLRKSTENLSQDTNRLLYRLLLSLVRVLAYRYSFPIGQLSPLDSYITSDPFALGSLIALMMEAARTSETTVDIQLRTRQYIPEDSEVHTRRPENLKPHNRSQVDPCEV